MILPEEALPYMGTSGMQRGDVDHLVSSHVTFRNAAQQPSSNSSICPALMVFPLQLISTDRKYALRKAQSHIENIRVQH